MIDKVWDNVYKKAIESSNEGRKIRIWFNTLVRLNYEIRGPTLLQHRDWISP